MVTVASGRADLSTPDRSYDFTIDSSGSSVVITSMRASGRFTFPLSGGMRHAAIERGLFFSRWNMLSRLTCVVSAERQFVFHAVTHVIAHVLESGVMIV